MQDNLQCASPNGHLPGHCQVRAQFNWDLILLRVIRILFRDLGAKANNAAAALENLPVKKEEIEEVFFGNVLSAKSVGCYLSHSYSN